MWDKIKWFLNGSKDLFSEIFKNEKEELKEAWADMWDASFGSLPFDFYWLPLGLGIIIVGIGLGGILSLWALSHPIILFIYLVYLLFFVIYVLHERFTGGL